MLCLEGALRSPMHTEVCIGLDIAHFLSFVYGFICNKDTYFTISSLFLITILIHVSLLRRHNLLICKIYLYTGQCRLLFGFLPLLMSAHGLQNCAIPPKHPAFHSIAQLLQLVMENIKKYGRIRWRMADGGWR